MKTIRQLAVCGVMALLGGAALAQVAKDTPVSVNISAQSMSDALNDLAAQTGLQLLFHVESVMPAELSAPQVVGEFTPTVALAKLLAGTDLSYVFLNERTVEIRSGKLGAAGEARRISGTAGGEQTEMRFAQTEEGSAAAGDAGSSQQDASNSAGGAHSDVLEEIIITAQKREERLQDVPISISVLNGADLDRFTGVSVNEALRAVPGLTVNQGGIQSNGAVITVRGVSAADVSFGGHGTTAYYMDSVPFALFGQAFVPDPNPYDLERIEILRGPQGTLYGANALNGVVRVLTRDADLNKFEAKTRLLTSTVAEGGETYRGDLAVNVPIVEGKLAARAVFGYADEGGWIDSLNQEDINSGHQTNARLKVNAQPTEQFSIGASAWFSRARYGASSVSDEDYFYYGVLDQAQKNDFDVFGLILGYEFSRVSVSSRTSYIDYTSEALLDATALAPAIGDFFVGTSYFTGIYSKILSEELLISSTEGASWRWSLGAFYRDEDQSGDLKGIFVAAPIASEGGSESSAVFGELTRLFWEGKLELTGGLRYYEDRVVGQTLLPVFEEPTRDTFTNLSPRVTLTWHPSADQTLYATYSEGFRPGIPSPLVVRQIIPGFPSADPDSLKNYELGVKGNGLNGRFSYDASVSYIDWADVHQTVGVPNGIGGVFAVTVNGESASGIATDLAMGLRLGTGWDLSAGLSWNDLGFDSDTINPATNTALFRKGDRLGLSSESTARVVLGYEFPLGESGLEGRFSASVNYQSNQATRTATSTVTTQSGDDLWNSRAEFSVGSVDRWRTMLFVDNVTDERLLMFPGNPGAPYWRSYTRPRSMGVQFEYNF